MDFNFCFVVFFHEMMWKVFEKKGKIHLWKHIWNIDLLQTVPGPEHSPADPSWVVHFKRFIFIIKKKETLKVDQHNLEWNFNTSAPVWSESVTSFLLALGDLEYLPVTWDAWLV